jgi:alpha-L-fucosidase 2
MVFGGVLEEKIVLNESSLWSGCRDGFKYHTDAWEHLPEIRRLLLGGKFSEAEGLYEREFLYLEPPGGGAAHGSGSPFGSYQVLGAEELRARAGPWRGLCPCRV